MTILECYQYVQNRMNKLSTNSGDNIEKHQFVEAFNSSQLIWAEDRFKLDELNQVRIDELQRLLKSDTIIPALVKDNYYEGDLPADYFHYKRSVSYTPCRIVNWRKKEGNINTLLHDEFNKPSLEWGETICTIVGEKLRIYVDNFSIQSVDLTYYRFPRIVNMKTAFKDANGNPTVDIDPEFEGASLIEILNYTCALLSGDVMNQFNLQLFERAKQQHT